MLLDPIIAPELKLLLKEYAKPQIARNLFWGEVSTAVATRGFQLSSFSLFASILSNLGTDTALAIALDPTTQPFRDMTAADTRLANRCVVRAAPDCVGFGSHRSEDLERVFKRGGKGKWWKQFEKNDPGSFATLPAPRKFYEGWRRLAEEYRDEIYDVIDGNTRTRKPCGNKVSTYGLKKRCTLKRIRTDIDNG